MKNSFRRWLVLTQYFPPEIGAPQIRLLSTIRELQRHGIQVEVLTAMPNYPAGKIFAGYSGRWRMDETVSGIPVHRRWVFAGTGKSAPVRLANYFSFTLTSLWAALTGPRPDVLFVESQPLSLGVVAILMKWLRRVPYVYNVPDLQVDVARQMGFMRSRAFLKLALAVENFFLRNAWTVSTVTDRFIQHFEGRGIPRRRISFLPNGADTTFLQPLPPSDELLDRWKLRGKKAFLYVGTHAFYHGLDTLIEAAALLRSQTDLVFLMIGDGPERRRLMEMARTLGLENVVFGESGYEEMDRLYSIAYASIATLRNIEVAKSMRLSKIFPSLSCAVPVIYAGLGEAADLLKEKQCGLTAPPEDPSILAETILSLAHDPQLRTRLGKAGRAFVEKEYGWPIIIKRWLAEIGLPEPASAEIAVSSSPLPRNHLEQ